MKMYAFFFLLAVNIIRAEAAPEPSPVIQQDLTPPKPKNCTITVRSVTFKGERNKITFKTFMASRKECAVLAKLQKNNFDRATTQTRLVSYQFVSLR